MTEFDPFAQRALLGEAEALALQRAGVLALDPERALPHWFDGRFLTARDLTREQNYFLARQSAVGRAIGRGVIEGLGVTRDPVAPARLTIAAGQGLAFDGNHILVPTPITVDLGDLAVQAAVNAGLGLSTAPAAHLRDRTGLFVLSLRAVEYTANDTASFPTSLGGARSLVPGDRIEAAAVTLTPYAAVETAMDADQGRALAAARLFLGLEPLGTPAGALPLAMLALRLGRIEWLDTHLVRRELIAARRDYLGLGLGRDQLRLAHFHQYRAALDDIVTRNYRDIGAVPRFAADQHFRVLPAAGPLPAACIDAGAQTQAFFPGEIEVELSLIPEDELPALLDDSFELPPIDLTVGPDQRDSLSVMILAPLPRSMLRAQIAALGALSAPLRPATVSGRSRARPLERLGQMRLSLAEAAAERDAPPQPASLAWAALVRSLTGSEGAPGVPYLWYVRRRTLRENVDLESVLRDIDNTADPVAPPVDGPGPVISPAPLGPEADAALLRLSNRGDLAPMLEAELRRQTPAMRAVTVAALGEEAVIASPLRVGAAVLRLGALAPGDVGGAEDTLAVLRKADDAGVARLDQGLVGDQGKISQGRLKLLGHFLGGGLFPRMAGALPRLDSVAAAKAVSALAAAIDSGADDTVTALVDETVKTADTPTPTPEPVVTPTPSPTPTPTPAPGPEAEAEAALLKSLPDRATQTRMAKVLDTADPVSRTALVAQLTKAELPRSQIATELVLTRLGDGAVDAAALGQVKGVTARFVQGLEALEPALLATPGTAPTELRGVRPTPPRGGARDIGPAGGAREPGSRGLARDIGPAGVARDPGPADPKTVRNRIARLITSPALGKLAPFGLANAAKPAVLEKAAEMLIPVLDSPAATPADVTEMIGKILGEVQ